MSLHIILSSHGKFALEAKGTAEMIIGHQQDNLDVVSVLEGRSYDECFNELLDKYNAVKDNVDGVIILVDIFAGTPSNIASQLCLTNDKVQVFSGLSIPILLELLLSNPGSIEEAIVVINNAYKDSFCDITARLKEVETDADSIDSY